MKKYIILKIAVTYIIIVFSSSQLFAVPNHPNKKHGNLSMQEYPTEIFNQKIGSRANNVPDSILVLLVEFSDVTFDLVPDYPDSVAHDHDYFERIIFHLSSYIHDASHGNYIIDSTNYTIWDNVLTLPETMGYYGNDEKWIERIAEFAETTFLTMDAEIDYSNFDSFIVFHAGAGQEADINNTNAAQLWSTFLSRKTLQAGLDEENDDFPGIITNERIIKEIVICPETEWQPDFEEGDPNYGLLGVVAHEFGHLIGLPTLFDNNSSNGRSYGIGNFGVMGHGAWNANGYVPPLPCAWSRYYMGWEDNNIEVIDANAEDLEITYPMSDDIFTKKLYRINISEKEYFLIENRQQNPDNSTINGWPNFTFELLPDSVQDYYPLPDSVPEGYERIPRFNFMENSYLGCEWDFFLPGPGFSEAAPDFASVQDGSGLFIWHIDENIIEANFSPDFENNSVNGDDTHKGVDLEEADGTQHMDAPIDINSLGSPYDSYRAGNNDYFGKLINPETNHTSLPTAESYYGGIPLAIKSISSAGNTMSFSVEFDWQLDADYGGTNPFPAAIIDIDNNNFNEIFYPMPNGKLALWRNDNIDETFINDLSQPIVKFYSYDQYNRTLLIPTYSQEEGPNLWCVEYNNFHLPVISDDKVWASHPVVNPNEQAENHVFLPLNLQLNNSYQIMILNEEYIELTENNLTGNGKIVSNLILGGNELFFVKKDENLYKFTQYAYSQDEPQETNHILSEISVEDSINSVIMSDLDKDNEGELILTTADTVLYCYSQSGNLLANFPVILPLNKASLPSITDYDNNGEADILISGENNFVIIDRYGNLTLPSEQLSAADSTGKIGGTITLDIDKNGTDEIIGNMSGNRLCVWQNNNNNDFILNSNYTNVFQSRSLTFPIIANYQDSTATEEKSYIFTAGNNGKIYRKYLEEQFPDYNHFTEYANLQRTAYFVIDSLENELEQNETFVKAKTYFYPNPFSKIYNQSIYKGEIREKAITLQIMTSKNTNVEIKIFDIAANLIKKEKIFCNKYISNSISINANKLASGVYFGILDSNDEILKLKFAIQK